MAEAKKTGLQKFFSSSSKPRVRKFSTFAGVFTPDVLTILGVIMYLRLGWVVGNAGFLGAVAIILLAKSVTIFTGLSMSSITTNIRIGAGGAYSIISKSLGLEAGGSIGIPLYIAQTLSAALYIIGFTESWLRVFPDHPYLLVAATAWLVLLTISYISASFAIKIQYIIMTIIGLSLVSFFLSPAKPVADFVLIGKFTDAGFWQVFAIFFPAVTGIMAGANMSGDLLNPRKAIPRGTMLSILITMVIYISLAYMAARIATSIELRDNQMIMVDKALFGPAVIAGIMGATFSSALGSMLGAPRILQALAEQETVPLAKFFARKTKNNEPRNAIIFSGCIIILALVLGNLDFLASLITMFFLITYGMLNLVVFIQQSMKIISFRPTFKVPRIVPFLGAIGCLLIMFLINALFSIIALIIIVFIYIGLERRGLKSNWGDIRGGMFLAIAERFSRMAMKFPRHQITWKPDLLVPIDDPKIWSGPLLFIKSITYPAGSLFAFTVQLREPESFHRDLDDLLQPIKNQGILVTSSVIEDRKFLHGARLVLQTLKAGMFQPNILFLTLSNDRDSDRDIQELVREAQRFEMGTLILRQHPRMAFGMQQSINLWLRDKSPNWHLAMLIALQLQLNCDGKINLVTATPNAHDKERLTDFLDRLNDQARLPSLTEFHVIIDDFNDALKAAPRVDINIFGLSDTLDFKFMRNASEWTRSSCLFVCDSGRENALV
ncbi:Na-K-Cl cotransporter [candidate division KSB1 bacterium]|nr:Na-K-Cl cotransporter [candidate division KSB1 bacterium]